jgi:putative spermidine/putrescine transport system substrate-binding protein
LFLGRRNALKLTAAGLAGVGGLGFAGRALAAPMEAAVKKEGQLNVITLPRDWANWGQIMDTFAAMYGVKIDDANPDGSSAEELAAIRSLKSQKRAPDAVDVGPAFAVEGVKSKLFAPYKVATWADIPADLKDPEGRWTGDYFGVVSFGVNTNVVKNVPKSWADLKKPEYKGMIALNGNPLGAAAAFNAVYASALAAGGSYDDIEPGIDYFGELAKVGNLNPSVGSPASLISGQTPIVVNWDYLNLGYKKQAEGKAVIEVVVPSDAAPFGGYYCCAISAYAPHPAAAKAWLEHIYSDAGQLMFLGGYAHPVRFNSLVAAGKVPDAVLKDLPPAEAYKAVKFATLDQSDKAKKVLADNWAKVVKI